MNQPKDDSQVSLHVALLAALYTAGFFIVIAILFKYFPNVPYLDWVEVVMKCISVILALGLASHRIKEANYIQNRTHIPFLSTFFYYGITLLLVYLGESVYIILNLIMSEQVSFIEEFKFFLGVREFKTSALLAAFFTGHLPYLVYYFFLKIRIQRLPQYIPVE